MPNHNSCRPQCTYIRQSLGDKTTNDDLKKVFSVHGILSNVMMTNKVQQKKKGQVLWICQLVFLLEEAKMCDMYIPMSSKNPPWVEMVLC